MSGLGSAVLLAVVMAAARGDPHQQELHAHFEHLAYIAHYDCHLPQPRVVSVHQLFPEHDLAHKAFFPDVTVLHLCDNGAGCCPSKHLCRPKYTHPVDVAFKVTFLENTDKHEKSSWIIENHTLHNHTECECVDPLKYHSKPDHEIYFAPVYKLQGDSHLGTYHHHVETDLHTKSKRFDHQIDPYHTPDHHLEPYHKPDHHDDHYKEHDHHFEPHYKPDHHVEPPHKPDHHDEHYKEHDHHFEPHYKPDHHQEPPHKPDHHDEHHKEDDHHFEPHFKPDHHWEPPHKPDDHDEHYKEHDHHFEPHYEPDHHWEPPHKPDHHDEHDHHFEPHYEPGHHYEPHKVDQHDHHFEPHYKPDHHYEPHKPDYHYEPHKVDHHDDHYKEHEHNYKPDHHYEPPKTSYQGAPTYQQGKPTQPPRRADTDSTKTVYIRPTKPTYSTPSYKPSSTSYKPSSTFTESPVESSAITDNGSTPDTGTQGVDGLINSFFN